MATTQLVTAEAVGLKTTPKGSYFTYRFRSHDPILNTVLSAIGDRTFREVSKSSGVSTSTLYAWSRGKTRRPQYATVLAVLRAAGKDMVLIHSRKS